MKTYHEFGATIKTELFAVIDQLLEYLYPTRCVNCEAMGQMLCDTCFDRLKFIDYTRACKLCGAPFGDILCTECAPTYTQISYPFSAAYSALEFCELSKKLILTYKDRSERRLDLFLGNLLAYALPATWFGWADCVTWIPADLAALKRRGFDHMQDIATVFANVCNLKTRQVLVKHVQKDQRSLNRLERMQNAGNLFDLIDKAVAKVELSGKNLLLLDDVFTTGATLSAASTVLKSAQVKEIRVATIARVW